MIVFIDIFVAKIEKIVIEKLLFMNHLVQNVSLFRTFSYAQIFSKFNVKLALRSLM